MDRFIDGYEVIAMSELKFKYCPFCGGQIPQVSLIKYCPFCGTDFFAPPNTRENKQVITDKITIQDSNIQDEKNYMECNIEQNYKMIIKRLGNAEYYSIILKGVSNKQSLVDRLEEVLLRGSFAIRLAVDNIPNIIVYKARKEDITFFSRVFFEEQASISIIPGDFNDKPLIGELFNDFNTLHCKVQHSIKGMPLHLWLGDQILAVFPNTYKDDKEGIVVVTDQNMFFIYENTLDVTDAWFIRSYSLLLKVAVDQKQLELTDKESQVHYITFQDKDQLLYAYQCIKKAVIQ